MQNDAVFSRFIERRARLMDRLDSSRVQFDAWIETHKSQLRPPTATRAARRLARRRRNMLDELLKLDDSLMDHLVVLLGRGASKAEA